MLERPDLAYMDGVEIRVCEFMLGQHSLISASSPANILEYVRTIYSLTMLGVARGFEHRYPCKAF